MKLTAQGVTDGATMVLFWPAHLPENADEQLQNDPMGLFEKLAAEGKLIQFPCEGDGDYGLAVYLNESIPEQVLLKCKEDVTIPRLIAKGDAYFNGGEYVFKHDRSYFDKYPQMDQPLRLPDGIYQATVYLSEDSSDDSVRWLRQRLSPQDRAVESARVCLFLLLIVSFLVGVVSLFAASWPVAGGIWAVFAVLVLLFSLLTRSPAVKRVQEAQLERNREFPAYLVQLTPVN
jgi:hypothetical protein